MRSCSLLLCFSAHLGVRDEFRWEDDDMPGLQKWDELKNKIRVFLSKNVRARGGWMVVMICRCHPR